MRVTLHLILSLAQGNGEWQDMEGLHDTLCGIELTSNCEAHKQKQSRIFKFHRDIEDQESWMQRTITRVITRIRISRGFLTVKYSAKIIDSANISSKIFQYWAHLEGRTAIAEMVSQKKDMSRVEDRYISWFMINACWPPPSTKSTHKHTTQNINHLRGGMVKER